MTSFPRPFAVLAILALSGAPACGPRQGPLESGLIRKFEVYPHPPSDSDAFVYAFVPVEGPPRCTFGESYRGEHAPGGVTKLTATRPSECSLVEESADVLQLELGKLPAGDYRIDVGTQRHPFHVYGPGEEPPPLSKKQRAAIALGWASSKGLLGDVYSTSGSDAPHEEEERRAMAAAKEQQLREAYETFLRGAALRQLRRAYPGRSDRVLFEYARAAHSELEETSEGHFVYRYVRSSMCNRFDMRGRIRIDERGDAYVTPAEVVAVESFPC